MKDCINTRILPWLRQHPAFSIAVTALLILFRLLYHSDRVVIWDGVNFLFTFTLILWLNITRPAPHPADIAAHPQLARVTERHWFYFLLCVACSAALLVLAVLSRV